MDYDTLNDILVSHKHDYEDEDGRLCLDRLICVLQFRGYNPVRVLSASVKIGNTSLYRLLLGHEGTLSILECERGGYIYMFRKE